MEKPRLPDGSPKNTEWFGGPAEWFSISLRIHGDDLVPEEISEKIGVNPNHAYSKGQLISKDANSKRIQSTGFWEISLSSKDLDEWDCDIAIAYLLRKTVNDLEIWKDITNKYKADVFVGIGISGGNKGFVLGVGTITLLQERNLSVGFDIYCDEK